MNENRMFVLWRNDHNDGCGVQRSENITRVLKAVFSELGKYPEYPMITQFIMVR